MYKKIYVSKIPITSEFDNDINQNGGKLKILKSPENQFKNSDSLIKIYSLL